MDNEPLTKLNELHAVAKAAVIAGKPVSQITARFKKLELLVSKGERTPIYHETYVLLAVSARARPSRANRHMSTLKKLRTAEGNDAAFEAFEAFLGQHMGGVHFTGHGFTSRLLGDVAEQDIYEGVHSIVSKINALGYQVFANSGTLLGLVRDRAPIAHDDDIDLAVVLKATTDEGAGKEFVSLVQKLNDAGIEADFVPSRAPIVKMKKIAGFQVDLFPAYGRRKRYSVYPYAHETLGKFDILPLKVCEVSGLPIPARSKAVLEKNYGAGWITPDPRFVFPWKRQSRKFKKLRNAVKDATD